MDNEENSQGKSAGRDTLYHISEDIARAIEEKTGRTEEDDNKKREYKAGGFTFKTYYEYKNAEDDIKRIEIIKKYIDLNDPEAAVRLYNMIRDGSIEFKSPIGEKYFEYVGDVVAKGSVDLLKDKQVVDEAEGAAKSGKILAIAVLVLAAVSFGYFAYSEIKDVVETKKIEKLQAENKKKNTKDTSDDTPISSDTKKQDVEKLEILPDYKEAHDSNPEMVGWLTIPGMDINYPVVKKNKDNNYYLTHAFDNSEDKNGSIFMDYRCDIVNPTTNTIIYGHNMTSGLMFGTLKNYLDQSFYNEHRTIEFNTLYEKREYEVEAVCLSEVAYQDDSDYRYYNFIQADTKGEWNEFYNDVVNRSVFGPDVDLKETDQILTLSTCNKYTRDGRLFIVAKRVK